MTIIKLDKCCCGNHSFDDNILHNSFKLKHLNDYTYYFGEYINIIGKDVFKCLYKNIHILPDHLNADFDIIDPSYIYCLSISKDTYWVIGISDLKTLIHT